MSLRAISLAALPMCLALTANPAIASQKGPGTFPGARRDDIDGIVVLHRGRIVGGRRFGVLRAGRPHGAMSVSIRRGESRAGRQGRRQAAAGPELSKHVVDHARRARRLRGARRAWAGR
jgi:hypothetical protein